MRNVIKTAATIRNVFAVGQDAAVALANDKRYGTRSYLNRASHSSPAHAAGAECRRGLVRWFKAAAARWSVAAETLGLAITGMAMQRQPVAPRGVRRLTVR
jgi:hypothetical protein